MDLKSELLTIEGRECWIGRLKQLTFWQVDRGVVEVVLGLEAIRSVRVRGICRGLCERHKRAVGGAVDRECQGRGLLVGRKILPVLSGVIQEQKGGAGDSGRLRSTTS